MKLAGRAAVVLVAPEAVTLGVYARLDSGTVSAHVRRVVVLPDATWPAVRAALAPLAALARARRADPLLIALRASLRPRRWSAPAAAEARRLGCEMLALSGDEELRWLFLGAVRDQRVQDGVVAELEPGGIGLARFRGRVLAKTARIGLSDAPALSGLVPGAPGEALLVTGALVTQLAARAGGGTPGRATVLARAAMAALARTRGPDAAAARALTRLLDWTGQDAAVIARDAVLQGLAATLLGAPVPYVR